MVQRYGSKAGPERAQNQDEDQRLSRGTQDPAAHEGQEKPLQKKVKHVFVHICYSRDTIQKLNEH